MVEAGHWFWLDPWPTLPGVPGIPVSNFAGWLLVALLMIAALDRVAARPPRRRRPAAAGAVVLDVPVLDDGRRGVLRPARRSRSSAGCSWGSSGCRCWWCSAATGADGVRRSSGSAPRWPSPRSASPSTTCGACPSPTRRRRAAGRARRGPRAGPRRGRRHRATACAPCSRPSTAGRPRWRSWCSTTGPPTAPARGCGSSATRACGCSTACRPRPAGWRSPGPATSSRAPRTRAPGCSSSSTPTSASRRTGSPPRSTCCAAAGSTSSRRTRASSPRAAPSAWSQPLLAWSWLAMLPLRARRALVRARRSPRPTGSCSPSTRAAYRAAGGHARAEVLDDLALLRALKRAGRPRDRRRRHGRRDVPDVPGRRRAARGLREVAVGGVRVAGGRRRGARAPRPDLRRARARGAGRLAGRPGRLPRGRREPGARRAADGRPGPRRGRPPRVRARGRRADRRLPAAPARGHAALARPAGRGRAGARAEQRSEQRSEQRPRRDRPARRGRRRRARRAGDGGAAGRRRAPR